MPVAKPYHFSCYPNKPDDPLFMVGLLVFFPSFLTNFSFLHSTLCRSKKPRSTLGAVSQCSTHPTLNKNQIWRSRPSLSPQAPDSEKGGTLTGACIPRKTAHPCQKPKRAVYSGPLTCLPVLPCAKGWPCFLFPVFLSFLPALLVSCWFLPPALLVSCLSAVELAILLPASLLVLFVGPTLGMCR